MRLLLVEDSKFLQKPLIAGLKASGYAIDAASDGEEGLWMARTYEYDVIVLDLMLPKLDGYQVLEALRHDGSETPVLILSARDSIDDRVRGLQRGADDYLVKPFAFEELSARIHNLTRRRYAKHTSVLRVADLEIDTSTKTARRGGITLTLAPKQFALLEYLMHRAGTVVSRTEIEAHLYDANAKVMSNVIDAAVSSLRRAITVDPKSPPLIQTKRGFGYSIAEPSATAP